MSMPRALPQLETVAPRILQTRGKSKLVKPTPKQLRETRKDLALTRRLRAAADRHDAGQMGEDVTDLSSADFIARLRR
ncbi:MAG: hypothetical protein WAP03_13505 [Methylorubrum rhodinum]|uniref:hypothetical protein n=1 Tax=Methylorubrum rhodinum TaxID=29428 RepID=UPI003BAF53A9